MSDQRKHITIGITEDQYNLARRKLYVEGLTWQRVVSALINSYIMGDVSVTKDGKYKLAPPSSYVPVIRIPATTTQDEVEIEPDWGTNDKRPAIGASDYEPEIKEQKLWGTREVVEYLRRKTGRRVSIQIVRYILREWQIEKINNRYYFEGETDETVLHLVEIIEDGTYDKKVRDRTTVVEIDRERRESELEVKESAKETTEQQRRLQHLKRLRKIEDS